ncbi:MAG TPA: hypothetical protein VF629_18520 [Hymenobacter sp.]|uniref:hypothetical protein n=1 Tax=Hymenobacter sp. TaxID=1898978 RepID=UPI002ED85E25
MKFRLRGSGFCLPAPWPFAGLAALLGFGETLLAGLKKTGGWAPPGHVVVLWLH